MLLFSHSVISDSLQLHELQHARLPCPSLSSRVCSNSCPLNQWCRPTISCSVIPFSSCLQFFPAIRVFSNESVHISFSISPSNEYSGLISFRIDLFDLLAVQGTLKSLLQHHSSKASILQHSAFFMVQLSHLFMTTGKTIALTIQTFVSKVISLLFNTLPRFFRVFLPRSKHLLLSWLQSPSAVIWEPKKTKSITISIVSPSICHEVMGPDAMILVLRMRVLKYCPHALALGPLYWLLCLEHSHSPNPAHCLANSIIAKSVSFFQSLLKAYLYKGSTILTLLEITTSYPHSLQSWTW